MHEWSESEYVLPLLQCEAGIYLSYDRSAKELQTVLSNRRLFLDDLTS